MTDETLAALERLLSDIEARGVLGFAKDVALIRALIERERLGNSDLACVLAYDSGYRAGLADAIAGGAHVGAKP